MNDDRESSMWSTAGWCLLGAAVLVVATGVVSAYEFSGASARIRIQEIVSNGLGIITAALVLGAVLAARVAGARARIIATVVVVISALIVAGAIYSLINMLTIHIPGPNDFESASIGFSQGGWKERFVSIAPTLAAALVAIAAVTVARGSAAPVSESPGIEAIPPG